jgi:hypothetical protein
MNMIMSRIEPNDRRPSTRRRPARREAADAKSIEGGTP